MGLSNLIRAIVILILVVLFILFAVYLFISYSLHKKLEGSSYTLFPSIVFRAQLLEAGVAWGDARRSESNQDSLQNVSEYIKSKINNINYNSISCDPNIDFSGIDPLASPSSLSHRISSSPIEVAVFFSGDVPDISVFLAEQSRDAFLGPLWKYSKDQKERPLPPAEITNDLRPWYRFFSKRDDTTAFRWRGESCGNYSYIVFQETK